MTTKENVLRYQVGGLLYAPALHAELADKITQGAYPGLTSVALCLEDSIQSEALAAAERSLLETLERIGDRQSGALPLLFVRVRNPSHLMQMHELLADVRELLSGYILPKFEPSNAGEYARLIGEINDGRDVPLYIMPILESRAVADIGERTANLLQLREILGTVRDYVLNIRVGGNDFSQLYGIRRGIADSIYDIGVIRDNLIDILNVFSGDYVVSGPVWEYFGDAPDGAWAKGLRAELALDRLNGFVGKTAIHPAQLPIICESLQVTQADYEDALSILDWAPRQLGVEKSRDKNRMNEKNCHTKWAERIVALHEIYGIRPVRDE